MKENVIDVIPNGSIINIFEILNIQKENIEENLLHITVNDISGWIYYSTFNPYKNDNWIIQDIVTIENKKFTIRKFYGHICSWGETVLYSKIRGTDKDIQAVITSKNDKSNQNFLEILAITEEKDSIDDKEDPWVYVKCEENEGWLFGGFTTIERGGPKYEIPTTKIYFDLSASNEL